ncbi:serine/threonine protein kinase [Gigaspora margarita]|uniref:Serine/threonine protein kinase n=1 Tax=Gigaspora margarita TaxID=4874 RepID=A0A8H4AQI2_GIGMA|nr:serine/threonine protein kinase [Gigaspora margarita]
MLQEAILENLHYPDYWKKSYCKWELKSWTSFFNETRPNESLQACHELFVAELKTLIENLNPKTHKAKKALALKQDFGLCITSSAMLHIFTMGNSLIMCNNEDPIPDSKKIKLFKHFFEEIETNKEFNFYVSSEHTIMDLY